MSGHCSASIQLTGLNSIKGKKKSKNVLKLKLKNGQTEEYDINDPPLAITGLTGSVKTYSLTESFTVKCSNGLRAEVEFNPEIWQEKKKSFLSFFGGKEEESKLDDVVNSDWSVKIIRKEQGKLPAHFCRVRILANEEDQEEELDVGIGTWLGQLKFDSDNVNNYNFPD